MNLILNIILFIYVIISVIIAFATITWMILSFYRNVLRREGEFDVRGIHND